MKYEIMLSEDKTYLRVRVFDTINEKLSKEFAGEAIKEAKQLNIKKFFIDVRGSRNTSGTFHQYLFGHKDLSRLGLEKLSKIAILTDEDDKSHDFIETVMCNAGYKCHLFQSERSVLEWFEENNATTVGEGL